jgi:tRNA (guanine37-N1)-methyltransferase
VLSGGEIPAMALLDAVVRQLPGVLNDADSAVQDSFVAGLLDCPHYTRPEVWSSGSGAMPVPVVLMSGNHERIARFRREQSLQTTARWRPDVLAQVRQAGRLSAQDERFLRQCPLGHNADPC